MLDFLKDCMIGVHAARVKIANSFSVPEIMATQYVPDVLGKEMLVLANGTTKMIGEWRAGVPPTPILLKRKYR